MPVPLAKGGPRNYMPDVRIDNFNYEMDFMRNTQPKRGVPNSAADAKTAAAEREPAATAVAD